MDHLGTSSGALGSHGKHFGNPWLKRIMKILKLIKNYNW